MNPKTPQLLSRVVSLADGVLDRPMGSPRRIAEIAQLKTECAPIARAPSPDGRALINDWTLMLIDMIEKAESLGVHGDVDEATRAVTLGLVLVRYVKIDQLEALQRAAAPMMRDEEQPGRRA